MLLRHRANQLLRWTALTLCLLVAAGYLINAHRRIFLRPTHNLTIGLINRIDKRDRLIARHTFPRLRRSQVLLPVAK